MPASSALQGVTPRGPSRRTRASERATCWTSCRERCDRSGRARLLYAAVRRRSHAAMHGRALLELCFRVCRSCSGEQRTQSHPEFCAACSRQRARITTAGDALASIGQPRTKLSAIIDASLSLIRRETSVLSGGEASAVVSMRPDKKINFTLFAACSASACCKKILLAPPLGGAARCGGPAASPLAALVCKMPSRGRGAG